MNASINHDGVILYPKVPVLSVVQVNEWKWNYPAIWINAGIHAREWISHSTALYIIYRVCTA